MAEKRAGKVVKINRAPVMTLWGAVVAEQLGYDHAAALTLGKAVAGLNAQSKGQRLGIFEESDSKQAEDESHAKTAKAEGEPATQRPDTVPLLGRGAPVVHADDGVRATSKGKAINPDSVQRYLEQKFGTDLVAVQEAMQELAHSLAPEQLANQAYTLYEQFRPEVPEGQKGWGAKGELDLDLIRSLAKRAKN
jgi:hypothetical protein